MSEQSDQIPWASLHNDYNETAKIPGSKKVQSEDNRSEET